MPRETARKCYFGCTPDKGKLHHFPYPCSKKFDQWKMVLNDIDRRRSHNYIYNNISICDHHFEKFYLLSNGYLLESAVPTLNIEANEHMATDVLVCGRCHSAFNFIDEFEEHKNVNNCIGKSPVRDCNENKPLTWAYLLWVDSSVRDGSNIKSDISWNLYQQWRKMPETQRRVWLIAGSNVQFLSKFAHLKESTDSTWEQILRRSKLHGAVESGEYVLAKRFNSRRKQYEYLLKWENFPHDVNTWEPVENMESFKHLLVGFEKHLVRQKELKALRAQQQHPVQGKRISSPMSQVVKEIVKNSDTPTLTPTGKIKVRALEEMKMWQGAEDESASKTKEQQASSENEDYSISGATKPEQKILNGQTSPNSNVVPVKSVNLIGKGLPHIKVHSKDVPNLTPGVYIMSKNSEIMKIDSPVKLGPGLNIDQDRRQTLAAKQKMLGEAKKISPTGTTATSQIRKAYGKTDQPAITIPSGQKTIQRPPGQSDGKSPVTILNKVLAKGDRLMGRGESHGRGWGVSAGGGNLRVHAKILSVSIQKWDGSWPATRTRPRTTSARRRSTKYKFHREGKQECWCKAMELNLHYRPPALIDEDGMEQEVVLLLPDGSFTMRNWTRNNR